MIKIHALYYTIQIFPIFVVANNDNNNGAESFYKIHRNLSTVSFNLYLLYGFSAFLELWL